MGKLTLLLGGARSGKSTMAEKLAAQRGDKILYVATAIPFDDEMKHRILNHQEQRPASWKTVESPTGVAVSIQDQIHSYDVVLLDCLTLLVNNLFMEVTGDPDRPNAEQFSKAVNQEINGILAILESSEADWIIVSNEVGLGLVPPYPLGRVYRDLLGRANQQLAARAEEVFLLAAGFAVPLHEVGIRL